MKISNTHDIPLQFSERVKFSTWEELTEERMRSREMKSEGLMIKTKRFALSGWKKKRRLVEMEN